MIDTIEFKVQQAAMKGNNSQIARLLKKVPDDQKADICSKALTGAIVRGELNSLKYLIANGADVNIKSDAEPSPVHYAVKRHRIEFLKVILEHGGNINTLDINGRTPLYDAINVGDIDLIRYLIDNGANLLNKDDSNEIPLDYAKSHRELMNQINNLEFEDMPDELKEGILNDEVNIFLKNEFDTKQMEIIKLLEAATSEAAQAFLEGTLSQDEQKGLSL